MTLFTFPELSLTFQENRKMANFTLVLVPAKIMKNGCHNIRIAVTHNSETRYIVTGILVDTVNEFKNGKVVKRPDKDALNLKLKKILNMYEERAEQIQYIDVLSCSQLVQILKGPAIGEKHRTFADIADEYLSQIDEDERAKSYKLYKLAINKYLSYSGNNSLMEQVTPLRINNYIMSLQKSKLSPTTINIYITLLKVIINYAKKMRYVNFEVDPFITAKVPSAKKRDTSITIEQLKRIRDAKLDSHNMLVIRDIFMLTYYLAGMNLVDMLDYNFKNAVEVKYVRKKTRNTKEGDTVVNFTIPDEAKPIIARYMDKKTGKLVFGRYSSYESCYNVLARKIKRLAEVGSIEHYFTLYSARKSFVQHGFNLGIPLSTLEYCIGQSMKEDRPIFNYVSIMKEHADKAIRKILDNLL